MQPIEMLLLAGTGAILTLRSPTARTVISRGAAGAWRYAAPAARSAGAAARDRVSELPGRVSDVRQRWAPQVGQSRCIHARTGCDWTGPASSSALWGHLRASHMPRPKPSPAPSSPRRKPSPHPRRGATDTRPAERVDEIAPGVYIGRQLEHVIDKIGLHMDEFRAVTRALNAAGDIEPTSLLQLLEALTGIQTTLTGVANLITEITDYADREMYVDLRALSPMYDAAGNVLIETQTVRAAMKKIRDLYAEEIAVEEKTEEGKVRQLNPKVVKAA